MTDSSSSHEKRTDSQVRYERSFHAIPPTWARLGRRQNVRDGHSKFYAEQVCVECRLTVDESDSTSATFRERTRLYVLYRNPDTGEAVERSYRASTIETPDDTVRVHMLRDGDDPGEGTFVGYPVLRPSKTENLGILPRSVFRGDPENFRAVIDVAPSETRLSEGVTA